MATKTPTKPVVKTPVKPSITVKSSATATPARVTTGSVQMGEHTGANINAVGNTDTEVKPNLQRSGPPVHVNSDTSTSTSSATTSTTTSSATTTPTTSTTTSSVTPNIPAVNTLPLTSDTQSVDYVAAITALLHSYGIGDIAQSVVAAVQKGYTPDTINLIMQDPTSTDPLAIAYQKRFPANVALFKAGKPVLSPAQYLNAEHTYAQVLQAHGLSQYATPDKFATLIANDVSPTEVNDRITLAVDKIQNADQATKDAMAQFYPSLNQKDILSAALNPSEGLPALQRKVQIAEIGGAALAQGLDASQTATKTTMGASALADLGITQQQAQTGYGNIGVYLPTAQKLSDIYSKQTQGYDQSTAEADVFQNLASAQRARQGLVNLEEGSFSGSSGTLGPSYGTPRSSFNNLTPGQI